MRNWLSGLSSAATAAAVLATAPAGAQQVADPGFKSVGRGAPLKADLRDYEIVGASIPLRFNNGAKNQDRDPYAAVS